MISHIHTSTILALCALSLATGAHAADPSSMKIGWVGLYNYEMIEWLENENRIAELCPPASGAAQMKCREEKLTPRVWIISVREKPEPSAAALGTITIAAVPGKGLSAAFKSHEASAAFTPDLYDVDWGYGPHFHQTYRDNRASWYLLPANPLPTPGWIDIGQLTKSPDIRSIEQGTIYTLDGKSIVVTRIQGNKVAIRPEQPADMWCEEGDPPKLQPVKPTELRLSDLLTRDGHLKLKIKNPRGC